MKSIHCLEAALNHHPAAWRNPAPGIAVILVLAVCHSSGLAQANQITPIGIGVAGQVHAVTYDPDHPDIIYVGGDQFGVFVTYDGGGNWAPFNRGLVDPENGRAFYVDDLLFVRDAEGNDEIIDDREGLYAATRGGIYFRADGDPEWVLKTDHERYSYYERTARNISDGKQPPSARPIEFSCFCYDSQNGKIYAGAGSARWYGPGDTKYYYEYFPTVGRGSAGNEFQGYGGRNAAYWNQDLGSHVQYSLWTLDVANPLPGDPTSADEWRPVDDPGTGAPLILGNVRRLACKQNIDGSYYIAAACQDGFWGYDSAEQSWRNLEPDPQDKTGYLAMLWPGNYWDVQFGSGATLYALQMNPLTHDPSLHSSVCTYDFINHGWDVYAPDDAVVDGAGGIWLDRLINTGFELTRLTVIPDPIDGGDLVLVGQRNNYIDDYQSGAVGYYLHKSGCGGQWVHVLGMVGALNADEYYYYSNLGGQYCDFSYVSMTNEIGWLYNDQIYPTVPLTVCPGHPDHMIAWLCDRPVISADSGETWSQAYCTSAGGGWTSRGLNEMAVNSLDISDTGSTSGRIAVGASVSFPISRTGDK